MPLPRALARFNVNYTNRVTMLFAAWMPGYGILTHVGRKSGKVYHTPINVFRKGEVFSVALTYGPRSEWVRNVMAEGGCRLQTMGREVTLTMPRVYQDPQRRAVPLLVRAVLRLLRVDYFLELRQLVPMLK